MNKFSLSLVVACTVLEAIAAQAQSNYQPYVFTTLAGNHPGYTNGTGSAARFDDPADLAVDSAGNVYVADSDNDTIRKITPAGLVTTYAGETNSVGSADGMRTAARFNRPQDIAADSSNNLFVADSANHTIRKITPAGVVTTIAGSAGSSGSNEGTGSAARFNFPSGVAVDNTGNIYVADSLNHTIRKITGAGVVTTVAGLAGAAGSDDGNGSAARFNTPRRVAIDNAGNVIVADTNNHTIRSISSTADVTTLAGTPGIQGMDDGPGFFASFYRPRGISVNSAGYIFVADSSNGRIRTISPGGDVSTFAGSFPGSDDGTGTDAKFDRPFGLTIDGAGNVFVADTFNHTIRKVTAAGVVSTFAGVASPGSENGTGTAARFDYPASPALDSAGNVYLGDTNNSTIRKITSVGVVTTFAGSAGNEGFADGAGSMARFDGPFGVAIDSSNNLYVADFYNNIIRKITPGAVVTTLAGSHTQAGSADGTGANARFYAPEGVAVDAAANVYVADSGNYTIRKITPGGVVSTLAGLAGNSGSVDGTGSAARFGDLNAVAVDNGGNIYVSDASNSTIRKITSAGVVTTIAGSAGVYGSVDGIGSAAQFNYPWGIAVNSSGHVFVADWFNHTIRKITPAGVVTTLAGTPMVVGWNDGAGNVVRFDYPAGLAVSNTGQLYVADSFNNSIRVGIPQLRLLSAASRKTHNAAGTFDINLPLTGSPGVECRSSGGNHKLVFRFSNNVVSGSASVTAGTGSVSGSPVFAGKTMTVNLTGVADVQKITVKLSGVTDNFTQALPDRMVSVNMLIGDTTGNKAVNASDISQTKAQSGTTANATNFRTDVTASGDVNASDISLVKSRSGFGVP